MVTLSIDISTLTNSQIEAISSLILTFRTPEVADEDNDFIPIQSFTGAEVTAEETESVTPAGVDLDSKGLPFDDRIHAGSRSRNSDGTWRYRRGIDKALVTEVESQLHKLMSVPAPEQVFASSAGYNVVSITPGGTVTTDLLPPPPPPPLVVTVTPPPPPPVVTVTPPPPPPPAVNADKMAFVSFIGRVTTDLNTKRTTADEIKGIVNTFGVDNLALLGNRLDLLPSVETMYNTVVAGR